MGFDTYRRVMYITQMLIHVVYSLVVYPAKNGVLYVTHPDPIPLDDPEKVSNYNFKKMNIGIYRLVLQESD